VRAVVSFAKSRIVYINKIGDFQRRFSGAGLSRGPVDASKGGGGPGGFGGFTPRFLKKILCHVTQDYKNREHNVLLTGLGSHFS